MAVWSKVNAVDLIKYSRIDGEFYKPEYLSVESKILSKEVKLWGQLGEFIVGPFGSAFHVNNYDNGSKYRYVRGKDVKPFVLLSDDNVYMPEKDYKRLSKYSLKKNDLLVSVVGTIGNVAILSEEIKGIFSCKSTVFRNSKINPYYLLAYFNGRYGRHCILRRQRGAIQTGLNKEDLKAIPVPIFSEKEMNDIGDNVKMALESERISQTLFKQAQEILENEFDITKQKPSNLNTFESKISEMISNNRIDSDYYQQKYRTLKDNIIQYKNGYQKLTDIAVSIKPNIDPSENPSKLYSYIELGNINASIGVINSSINYYGRNLPSRAKRKVTKDDIIASAVVGSVDKVAIVNEDYRDCVASTGFFHFRVKNDIPPEYLLLLIKSKCLNMQLQQESTGGILSAVPDERIRNIIIPKVDKSLQYEVANIVKKSHIKYRESKTRIKKAIDHIDKLMES